jgi:hypothetical protein
LQRHPLFQDRLLQVDPLDLLRQERRLQAGERQRVDVVLLERGIRPGGGPRQIGQSLVDVEQLSPVDALLGPVSAARWKPIPSAGNCPRMAAR